MTKLKFITAATSQTIQVWWQVCRCNREASTLSND